MKNTINNLIFGIQYEFGKPFTMVIDTRNLLSGGSTVYQFEIPFRSSQVNALVDWGDGSFNRITSWNSIDRLHTYTTKGIYTIKIYTQRKNVSDIYRISLMFYNNLDRLKLLEVIQFGTLSLDANTFRGCANLNLLQVLDLPLITNLAGTFSGCSTMTSIKRISEWNLYGVTDFNTCFSDCTNFNQDLSSWNMSAATNISSMFLGCTNFNQDLSSWNVKNVTNMASVFQNATSFNRPLNSWVTSNVTTMIGMFAGASSFNQPLNSWNVAMTITMNAMFQSATNFNQDLSSWNFNINVTLSNIMRLKTFNNYDATYYDNLLIALDNAGRTDVVLGMGTIKCTSGGMAARNNLINKRWIITDGVIN